MVAGVALYNELTDEEKGIWDTLEDVGAVASFGGVLFVLWVPPALKIPVMVRVGLVLAPLAVPTIVISGAYLAGAEISHYIDPEDGRRKFKEFISEPQHYKKRLDFTLREINKHVIQPEVTRLQAFAELAYNYAERKLRPFYELRYQTGPYLPF
jgi:hypothetical protein